MFKETMYQGYVVNKTGVVKSVQRVVKYRNGRGGHLHKGRVLKFIIKQGYHYVGLSVMGKVKHEPAHRLVAVAFIPNPGNKPFINHKNGVKNDNRVENLEWCTVSENTAHAFRVLKIKHPQSGKARSNDEKRKISIGLKKYHKTKMQ